MKLRIVTWFALLSMLLGLAACQRENKEYLNNFEIVWQTVNETYFDPTFGGVDWNEVHDRYRPLIAAAESDEELYSLINKMLWELNVSHAAIIPPGYWPHILPTIFAEGSIGIDVRLLDGEAVIKSIEAGSPGDKAGLRPGFVIQRIDGIAIKQIAEEAELNMLPPYNSPHRVNCITREILSRIYGQPEAAVSIAYLDEHGETNEKSIVRKARAGKINILPPIFLEFESERLDNSIGYIRFNIFLPPEQVIVGVIKSMHDAPGLIFDFRGNPGGDNPERLAKYLVKERALVWRNKTRDRTVDVVVEPAETSYEGPVVVLIDAMSMSASELFAAGLQAIGRAVIVGERSPGAVTKSELMQLPNGAYLMYPEAQHSTPDGIVLEGHGVVPDIEVSLDSTLLLQGIDSQLEAAIRYIKKEMGE